MSLNLIERVKTGFPKGIDFPDILSQLCSWYEKEGNIIGDFELHEHGRDFFSALIEEENHQERFAIFGVSGDASVYCIWLQDDGKKPVIYLSKHMYARMMASDIEDFIALLAIGYKELPDVDKSLPPESNNCYSNDLFQEWVIKTLNTSIATTGQAIVDRAIRECDDINKWLSVNCNGW